MLEDGDSYRHSGGNAPPNCHVGLLLRRGRGGGAVRKPKLGQVLCSQTAIYPLTAREPGSPREIGNFAAGTGRAMGQSQDLLNDE